MYKASRFQVASPGAQANGQVLMPYFNVLSGSDLDYLIAQYGLDKLDPQAFYPQQTVCDMQRQMFEQIALFSDELVDIGVKSIESIGFPPEVRTVEDALGMLHQIYQMIHRNIPAEEGWSFRRLSDDELLIYFNAPYEPYAAYGYIYGIVRRFRAGNQPFTVRMEEDEGLKVFRVQFQDVSAN